MARSRRKNGGPTRGRFKKKKLGKGQGYDAQKGEFGDMVAKGIIDPAKVTRSAIENAVSIAAMVLTTNCLVTEKPEAAAGGMPAGAPPMY